MEAVVEGIDGAKPLYHSFEFREDAQRVWLEDETIRNGQPALDLHRTMNQAPIL